MYSKTLSASYNVYYVNFDHALRARCALRFSLPLNHEDMRLAPVFLTICVLAFAAVGCQDRPIADDGATGKTTLVSERNQRLVIVHGERALALRPDSDVKSVRLAGAEARFRGQPDGSVHLVIPQDGTLTITTQQREYSLPEQWIEAQHDLGMGVEAGLTEESLP